MRNQDTANLWLSLKKLGNFKDTYYDKSLLDDLRHELSIGADDDIEKSIQEFAPEKVLDAFFAVISPLSVMYADILNLFEHCDASRSAENVTIEFDISKSKCTRFDVSHFMHAKQVLGTVRELTNKMLPTMDGVKALWHILDWLEYKALNVHNKSFREWGDEYWNKMDSWPEKELDFVSVINNLQIRDELMKAFRFWQTLFDFYQNTCPDKNVKEMPKNWHDHDDNVNISCELLWAETDHCLFYALNNLYFIAENFPRASKEEQARYRMKLDKMIQSIQYKEEYVEKYKRTLKEFLMLPVWKHRYEVYSIWIFTRIMKEIPNKCVKYHVKGGVLSFPFSGACLASATLNSVTYDIWTELRTRAIVKPVGKGRTKNIQPDCSIVCGDPKNIMDSIMAIECKQYKKSSTYNFSNALIDYTHNRPMATAHLVDYGEIAISKVENAMAKIPRNRYELFSLCRPGTESADRFSNTVFQTLIRRSNMIPIDKHNSTVFSLLWNTEDPMNKHQDLDLHLIFQQSGSDQSRRLSYSNDEIPGAQYSGDVRFVPGLEQIVIRHYECGVYDLWVNNFTSSIPFELGEPVLVVTMPSEKESIKIELPYNSDGHWWHVLRVDSTLHVIQIINKRERR